MRRCVCLFAVLVIFGYLIASRTDWFTEAAKSPVARNPLFSDTVNLKGRKTITWKVPKDSWTYRNGKAQLSLALNLHLLREIPHDRSQVELRAKVSAFGVRPDGEQSDRLIRDSYYKTDEPFSKDGVGLWETYGLGRLEYGLGAVDVRPDEDLKVELSVMTPDPQLALGNPRLKLVGYHDYAGLGLQYLLLASLRDIGMALSLVLLIVLCVMAWGKRTQQLSSTLPTHK